MKKSSGFTLVELMIVIAIAAILATIAVPAYRDAVKKGNRRAAQALMMDIVNRQHEFFLANRTYASTSQIALCASPPPEISPHYTCSISVDTGPPPGFAVTFSAIGSQTSDGNLTVDSLNVKTPANKWK